MIFKRTLSLLLLTVPFALCHDREAALAQFADFAKRRMETDTMPGLTIGYVLGDEIWVQAYGFSDLENRLPMKPESAFRLASVTKTMTAIGVFKLVESGKVDLDAEVQTYVPDFPRKRWPITVRQLLGHLGGISHYQNYDLEGHFKVPMNTAESLAVFQDFDLVAEPGTRYVYSSYGFNLLGAVIEGAAGESFESFLQRELWSPAGMKATRLDSADELIPNRVRGYRTNSQGRIINSEFVDISSRFAGGGTRSTVPDLLHYAKAIMSGEVLADESLKAMFTSMATKEGQLTDYGMGWSIRPINGRFSVAHGGAQAETRTYLILFPSDQFAMAVACNFEGGDRMPYIRRLYHAVLGEPWEPPMVADKPADEALLDGLATCFQRGVAAFEFFGPTKANKNEVAAAFAYLGEIVASRDPSEARRLVDHGRHPHANQALVTVGRYMAQQLDAANGPAWRDQVHGNGPLAFFNDYQELVKSYRSIPHNLQIPKRIRKKVRDWSDAWQRSWVPEVQQWAFGEKPLDDRSIAVLQDLMQGAEVKPDLSSSFEAQAQQHFAQGNIEGALALLESCLSLYPNDDAARVQAGICYLVAGNRDKATNYIKHAHQLRPNQHAGPGQLNNYAYMLAGAGLREAGSALLTIAIELHPKVANLYDSYAEFQLQAGYKDEAIRWYQKALAVDPEFENAKSMLERIAK